MTNTLRDAIEHIERAVESDNADDLLSAMKDSTYRDFDMKSGRMIDKRKKGLLSYLKEAASETEKMIKEIESELPPIFDK